MALVANNQLIYKGKSSFYSSGRDQFHLNRLVVMDLLLSSPTSSLRLIGSSDLTEFAHCYSPWPGSSEGGVASEGTSCMAQQQQTPPPQKMERGDWESFLFKICSFTSCFLLNSESNKQVRYPSFCSLGVVKTALIFFLTSEKSKRG